MQHRVWLKVLEFLYTGLPTIKDKEYSRHTIHLCLLSSHLMNLLCHSDGVEDLLAVAELFRLDHLVTICKNAQAGEEFLNPSIGVSPTIGCGPV